MEEIQRPDIIRDESHAKAIVRNWVRNGEMLHQENLKEFLSAGRSRSRNNFFKMIDSFEKVYGDLMVNRRNATNSKGNQSKRPRFVELAFFSDRKRFPYHQTKLLPIAVIAFDTKSLDFTDPVCAFYLSEHLLARLVMRSQAVGLKDIANWAKAHYLFIMEAKFRGNLPSQDFILLSRDSFIPFTYINKADQTNGLVAKTWIPRSEWTEHMLSKLTLYFDEMDQISGCNVVLIDAASFNLKI